MSEVILEGTSKMQANLTVLVRRVTARIWRSEPLQLVELPSIEGAHHWGVARGVVGEDVNLLGLEGGSKDKLEFPSYVDKNNNK